MLSGAKHLTIGHDCKASRSPLKRTSCPTGLKFVIHAAHHHQSQTPPASYARNFVMFPNRRTASAIPSLNACAGIVLPGARWPNRWRRGQFGEMPGSITCTSVEARSSSSSSSFCFCSSSSRELKHFARPLVAVLEGPATATVLPKAGRLLLLRALSPPRLPPSLRQKDGSPARTAPPAIGPSPPAT